LTNLSLEELRLQYDKIWSIKATLEDKAKNVISTAGIIVSLVFGFITFSTTVFKFTFPSVLIMMINASIIASVSAIFLSIKALRVQDYGTILETSWFGEGNNRANFIGAQDNELIQGIMDNYVRNIIDNSSNNEKKATNVEWATYLLFASVILIGVTTIGITFLLAQNKSVGPILVIPDEASNKGNISYIPNPITVIKGDTIKVENRDSFIHTVTSGKGPNDSHIGELFDTNAIKPGESANIVIANLIPGQYPFFCTVHPFMTGSLNVIDLNTVNATQKGVGSGSKETTNNEVLGR
jgi:plastocyanin